LMAALGVVAQGGHIKGDLSPSLKTRPTRPSDDWFHRLRRQPDVRPNVMAGRLNEGR
jgi:hypothetical protein